MPPIALLPSPTQAQSVTQETAFSCVPSAPDWFGVVPRVHVVPFQASASVASPVAGMEYPTAEHEVILKQSTPCRRLSPVPALGLGTSDHEAPFHCSTNVWSPVPVMKPCPTAVHQAEPMHETPVRSTML